MDAVPVGHTSLSDALKLLVQAALRRRRAKPYEEPINTTDPIAKITEAELETFCIEKLRDELSFGSIRVLRRQHGREQIDAISPSAFRDPNVLSRILELDHVRDDYAGTTRSSIGADAYFVREDDFGRWLSAAMPKPHLRFITEVLEVGDWLKPEWVQALLGKSVPIECCDLDDWFDVIPQFIRRWASMDFLNVCSIKAGEKHPTLIPALEWQYLTPDGSLASARHDQFGRHFYTNLRYHRDQVELLLPQFDQLAAQVCLADIQNKAEDQPQALASNSSEALDGLKQRATAQLSTPRYVRPYAASTLAAHQMLHPALASEIVAMGKDQDKPKRKPGRPPGSGIQYLDDDAIAAEARELLRHDPSMRIKTAIVDATQKLQLPSPDRKGINRIGKKLGN